MTLDEYILKHSDSEPELLRRLNRDAHVNLLRPRMLSGALQGRILKMICRMVAPQRILEIGTFAGYSALCFAEALPDDGVVDTIEIDDELEDFIRKYWDLSPVGNKINLIIGSSEQVVPSLSGPYDLVFLDADKRRYWEDYELVLPLVRKGGFILADNTLWDSKVLQTPHHTDEQTLGILRFNENLVRDERVEKVILPLRDGLTLIYKK